MQLALLIVALLVFGICPAAVARFTWLERALGHGPSREWWLPHDGWRAFVATAVPRTHQARARNDPGHRGILAFMKVKGRHRGATHAGTPAAHPLAPPDRRHRRRDRLSWGLLASELDGRAPH